MPYAIDDAITDRNISQAAVLLAHKLIQQRSVNMYFIVPANKQAYTPDDEGFLLPGPEIYVVVPSPDSRWNLGGGENAPRDLDFHGNGEFDGTTIGVPLNPMRLGGLAGILVDTNFPYPVLDRFQFEPGRTRHLLNVPAQGAKIKFIIGDLSGAYSDNAGSCDVWVKVRGPLLWHCKIIRNSDHFIVQRYNLEQNTLEDAKKECQERYEAAVQGQFLEYSFDVDGPVPTDTLVFKSTDGKASNQCG